MIGLHFVRRGRALLLVRLDHLASLSLVTAGKRARGETREENQATDNKEAGREEREKKRG